MKFTLKKTLAAFLTLAMLAGFTCTGFAADVRTIKDVPPPAGNSFSFLAAGDPQIGAGGLESSAVGWMGSLSNALAQWGDAAFLVTAGDNIDTRGSAAQLEGFLAPLASLGIAVAPTPGNHDQKEILDIFDLPNRDDIGNYWYTYGGALFMHLDTNNSTVFKMARFLISTVRANSDATWKFVVFHHTFYTAAASRAYDLGGIARRLFYGPLFDLLGMDMALMGHDHVYIRTKPMKFWMPNEGGTTYVTLNSASGSKYYDMVDREFYYSQVQMQPKVPMLSRIDVTPQALTLTTCRTDTMEVLDFCVITK